MVWHSEGDSKKSKKYLDNLTRLHEACDAHGITFVVATQQCKSYLLDRDAMRGITYQEEVELVEKKLKEHGSLGFRELCLLIHSELMGDLKTWAGQRGVHLVDLIGALDANRDELYTWVHLSPAGNMRVAAALAEEIREVLPDQ